MTTALAVDGAAVLALHPRADRRGQWVVEAAHWDGLADGHTRETTIDDDRPPTGALAGEDGAGPNPLATLLASNAAAQTPVARRDLSSYDTPARGDDEQGKGVAR